MLDFLERIDHQIKIRGFRVEPGEIEAVLKSHPGITQAAVVAREERAGEKRLVAYVVCAAEHAFDEPALKEHVGQRLPGYMTPAVIMPLEALPLTPNGKLDRKALPEPNFATAPWRAPTNPTEEALCQLFAELLSLPRVGLDDNFFALGGDSIVAIQLVSRARRAGLVFTPRDIFQYQTVEGLAAAAQPLPGGGEVGEDGRQLLRRARLVHLSNAELSLLQADYTEIEDILPLSPMQEGMLFHATFDPQATDVYSTQLELRFEGRLDVAALQNAIARLLRRHAPLRTGFRHEGLSRPAQVVLADCPSIWQEHDLAATPEAERDSRIRAILDGELTRRFDLAKPPLIRFCLIHERLDRHRVAVTVHHVVLDGWSVPILVAELNALYLGRDVPDPTPYRDYVQWLTEKDRDSAVKFWRKALEGIEGLPQLVAADKSRSALQPERITCDLSERLDQALRALAKARNITLSSVFQAAWGILLSRLTGRWDTVFGVTVSGRPAELPGVEAMLGLFINTMPVRLSLRPDLAASSALQQAFVASSQILEHHHISLAEIQRVSGVRDLFDTLFLYENYPDGPRGDEPSPPPFVLSELRDASHYPLCLCVQPKERLRVTLSYQPDLLERQTVEALGARLVRVLEAIVEEPERRIGQIDVLLEQERQTLLGAWNDTALPVAVATLPDLFEQQVRRTPAAPAVILGETRLCYGDLNRCANRLADLLIRRGIGPEKVVGVALGRSIELVASLLAI